MERLTTKRKDGRWAIRNYDGATPLEQINKIPLAIDRLAAYEDIGLYPQEIKIILERYHAFRSAISDETGQPMVSWTRASEICRAEKDGRLVVLPCKPDASAYQWKKGDDIPSLFRFDGVTISEDGEITYQTHWGETFKSDDFGKTVFLTREEAEAELKKREEEDNETD